MKSYFLISVAIGVLPLKKQISVNRLVCRDNSTDQWNKLNIAREILRIEIQRRSLEAVARI